MFRKNLVVHHQEHSIIYCVTQFGTMLSGESSCCVDVQWYVSADESSCCVDVNWYVSADESSCCVDVNLYVCTDESSC
jgi:hypothetical protein